MDGNADGTDPYRGVNPATGLVVYYQLPELKTSERIVMEIKDAQGNLIRSFSSVKDTTTSVPSTDPLLPKSKGLNRFVWNLRYPSIISIPGVYIESNFRGHKASPGKYTLTLKKGDQTITENFEILPNPLYPTDVKTYQEYHTIMNSMELEVNKMHEMIMTLDKKRKQLDQLLSAFPPDEKHNTLKKEGQALSQKMKQWDEDMIQRKSKVYDDVENFPNKFTANYLFLINQTESDIPRVNKASLDRMNELNTKWNSLEARAREILDREIPAFNKQLWNVGVGAVWEN
jgi:hypothetical protein